MMTSNNPYSIKDYNSDNNRGNIKIPADKKKFFLITQSMY